MIKFLTFLLMFGATQALASPMISPQETVVIMLEKSGPSEQVLGALFDEAAIQWSTTTQKLWGEYRNDLLDVKKQGVDPATGHHVYELNRVKTGGSLILILDVDSL